MKAIPITRIVINLSVDEARAAVTNATDLQLAIHAAIYQLEPKSIVQLVNEHNGRKALAAPKKLTTRKKPARRECPVCHQMKAPQGFKRHVAGCTPSESTEA